MLLLKKYILDTSESLVSDAQGILHFQYITPSAHTTKTGNRSLGDYRQQYDWDTFFIALAFSKFAPDKLTYIKGAFLNFLSFTTTTGKTPRTISPERIWDFQDQHKPFLAQEALLLLEHLPDTSWFTKTIFEKLIAYISYWENTRGMHGLARWQSALESGVDNNATIVNLPPYSAESADLNTYLYLEYKAMGKIARFMEYDPSIWEEKANIQKLRLEALWDEEEDVYHDIFNTQHKQKEFIRIRSFTNFLPLFAKIPSKKNAKKMIEEYLLNEEEFLSPFGFRSLSLKEPTYNTAKRDCIYEFPEERRRVISNWQGPIWINANWMLIEGLKQYGYDDEAREIINRLKKLLEKDLKDTGTLHENYNPETGEGLWAPNFGSWNLLAGDWIK